jgi:hypothetical protein
VGFGRGGWDELYNYTIRYCIGWRLGLWGEMDVTDREENTVDMSMMGEGSVEDNGSCHGAEVLT